MQKAKLAILLGLGMFILAACGAAVTQTAAPQPTEPAVQPASTLPPTATMAPVVDECLACHTDKDKLVSLAKPEEDKEGESKGVG